MAEPPSTYSKICREGAILDHSRRCCGSSVITMILSESGQGRILRCLHCLLWYSSLCDVQQLTWQPTCMTKHSSRLAKFRSLFHIADLRDFDSVG